MIDEVSKRMKKLLPALNILIFLFNITVQAQTGETIPSGTFANFSGGGALSSQYSTFSNPAPAAIPTIARLITTGNVVACLGVASVSPYIQQFTVNGTNLTGDITATVVGAQFEISLNPNSGYSASLTIPQTGGAVNGVVVYARAAATTSAGNLTGGVSLTSPGALTVNAGLSGIVNGLPTMGGMSPKVFTGGQLTSAINFIANGNNVSWTNSNPAIGLPATGTGNILPFMAANAGNTPITATIIATPVSVAGGCTGTPISFVITVNPAAGASPSIAQATATGNNIACLGAASVSPNIQQFTVNATNLTGGITAAVSSAGFEISLNASSGYTNSLTIPQTGGTVNSVIVYIRLAVTTTAGNFTGGVMLTSPGAAPVNVGSISGVVNVPPVMDGNVPSPTYINGQQTAAINFSANGNTVNWINDTPGIGLPASGTGDIPSFTAVNNGTTAVIAHIIATPTNPITGCTGTPVPFTITVNPTVPPNIVVIGPLSPLNTIYGTASTSAVFNVLGSGLSSGILVIPPPGFEVSTNDVTFAGSAIISSAGTQVYIRLAATTHAGNNYAGPIVLKSPGASDASIDMPASSVTPAPLTITADNKRKTFGTANPVLTATYTGFVNGDTPADFTSPLVLSTIADISSPIGQYPITLSGYASNDYSITPVQGVLTVIGAIVIPNTFTPNGDGINDTWNIKYLDTYSTCTVQIFNRYGESVYSSIGYGTPWDGTFKGAKLPTGTYYYVINLKNDTKLLSGFIALIK
ncbi:hypothetical protein MgSA37_02066 [Mucilaginibacter gotjawali]|uniref:MBG domain-containing protein n=2 Tax=Mucilaginibacter gotjawali TaxID=1550579 RepID=A0A0X8X145_9SPHI|nr:hypothetical protein MgSA37_02066 [Mucilaginibacter gotjawali]